MKRLMRLILAVSLTWSALAVEQTYRFANDSRCISSNVTSLQNLKSMTSDRQCATKCLANSRCALFMIDRRTTSCLLYQPMIHAKYLDASYYQGNSCKVWYKLWLAEFAIFSSSGQFEVPFGVSFLRVLAVGGGGGGAYGDGGGGGSGFVTYANLTVSPGQIFNVSVGAGGNSSSNGSDTIFGNSLVVAQGGGGLPTQPYHIGAPGGSGGGGGLADSSSVNSGSGGSAGSSGFSNNKGNSGGSGQGDNFSSYFSQFRFNNISAGSGADGVMGDVTYHLGGGGGGGVLINGAGPNSTAGVCCNGYCGPGPASGYGAGGSASCWTSLTNFRPGGLGASGLVYIEFN